MAAWGAEGRSPFYARAWERLLSGPTEALAQFLVADTEEARALRQATPFAGALEPRERWRIWRKSASAKRDDDLVLSKYVAGREKDDRFVRAALAAGLVSPETLSERLTSLPIDEQGKERIRRRIRADARH